MFITSKASPRVMAHEAGHCAQSEKLGWLYIPIIAIPSLLHNLYIKIVRLFGKDPNYYTFYTEKWANELGGTDLGS